MRIVGLIDATIVPVLLVALLALLSCYAVYLDLLRLHALTLACDRLLL